MTAGKKSESGRSVEGTGEPVIQYKESKLFNVFL